MTPVFTAKVNSAGKLQIDNADDFALYVGNLAGKDVEVVVKKKVKNRTSQQNKALHLYFTLLATALNEAGFDLKKVLLPEVDIPFSPYNIKEYLWRPVQEAQLGKKSTTQLTTSEIDIIYDTVNRAIAERTGISIPFPSIDNQFEV